MVQNSRDLQTQIEIIQGRRSARPSGSLRGLETQVLGPRAQRQSVETQRWVHPSLDAMVVASSVVSSAAIRGKGACTSAPAVLNHAVRSTGQSRRPISSPFSRNLGMKFSTSSPTDQVMPKFTRGLCSPFSNVSSVPEEQTLSPEFSAPGQSRFEIEPFEHENFSPAVSSAGSPTQAPTHSRTLFRTDSSRQWPTETAQTSHGDICQADPLASAQASEALMREMDDGDWITAAQAEQTQEITEASKKSLDTGLSLVKDDFERELASILGTSHTPNHATNNAAADNSSDFLERAAQAQNSRESASQSNGAQVAQQAAQQSGSSNAQDDAEPSAPAHPTHDVFDRMGLGLQYANSFDLGQVNLNDRFEGIEQALDGGKGAPQSAPEQTTVLVSAESGRPSQAQAQSFENPFIAPEDLDDFDLVAELAQIGGAISPADNTAVISNDTRAGDRSDDNSNQISGENVIKKAENNGVAPEEQVEQLIGKVLG